jgi:hypothetical protein
MRALSPGYDPAELTQPPGAKALLEEAVARFGVASAGRAPVKPSPSNENAVNADREAR